MKFCPFIVPEIVIFSMQNAEFDSLITEKKQELERRASSIFKKADAMLVEATLELMQILNSAKTGRVLPPDSLNEVLTSLRDCIQCPEILIACKELVKVR